ncbi:hypothetical protein [Amycolatopsis granulosa]|uniref:hypothetical protein n=1 Tax=Amycolatopsis granulosa TaxID=185684 RepID=UPI0014216CCA|nr:hypothetical protein [Amycolatopsis granulosa]NIH85122.1 hypothetical protein [Amycolatopsis granulosa]
MIALLTVLLLVALVVSSLNHNHRRQGSPRMSGSFDVADRDAPRIDGEVTARRGDVPPVPQPLSGPRLHHR